AQFLLLLHYIQCSLGKIASLARGAHTANSLLQRKTSIAYFNANPLFEFLEINLRLPVFELGAILVGLGNSITQRNLKLKTDLVLRRRVVERVRNCAAESSWQVNRGASQRIRDPGITRTCVKPVQRKLRQQRITSRLAAERAVLQHQARLKYLRAILQCICHKFLHRIVARRNLRSRVVKRNYRHVLQYWIIERTR